MCEVCVTDRQFQDNARFVTISRSDSMYTRNDSIFTMPWCITYEGGKDIEEYTYLQIQGRTLYLSGRFGYKVKLWKDMPKSNYSCKAADKALTLFEDDKNQLQAFLNKNGLTLADTGLQDESDEREWTKEDADYTGHPGRDIWKVGPLELDLLTSAQGGAAASAQGGAAKRKNDCLEAATQTEEVDCVICMDNPRTHAFVPCGHLCLCETCVGTVCQEHAPPLQCPLCKAGSTQLIQIYYP